VRSLGLVVTVAGVLEDERVAAIGLALLAVAWLRSGERLAGYAALPLALGSAVLAHASGDVESAVRAAVLALGLGLVVELALARQRPRLALALASALVLAAH